MFPSWNATFFPHEPNTFTFLMELDPAYDPVTGKGFGFEFEFTSVKGMEGDDGSE